jgi:prolyl-tRNA synthetase
MVIRPNGYAIWENMKSVLDGMFKDTGHVNAYFPLLIPESFMRKEAEHVEGFAPECAIVTHGGGKKLEEPLYLRPTSETVIWSMYRKWIRSYRDLPLLINQWANVIRWEMRTRLFLRTTEFLWQEGHTAHATHEEALQEARMILDLYRRFAEDYMAMPVLVGTKTDKEKFAGALTTFCIEALTQEGKALQAGTTHDLGQNFAKAFDVRYLNPAGEQEYVWATSWGVSTRLVGGLVMVHGDDRGLIIPPKLATNKLVIVPIYKDDAHKSAVLETASRLQNELAGPFGSILDDRDQYKPGWKFAEWELRGVPLRLEIGPRDLEKNQVTLASRCSGGRRPVPMDEVAEWVQKDLDIGQQELSRRAQDLREKMTTHALTLDTLADLMESEGGFGIAPWCGSRACEDKVQERTKATIRVVPFEKEGEGRPCLVCGQPSLQEVYFAKAY